MSDILKNEIASNVKRLRSEAGYTQDQVAQKIGITWRNYQRYEKAKVVPKMIYLERLAKLYGVSVEEILGQTPGPKGKEKAVVTLARDLAVLQDQVNDLIAWKRDHEREMQRIVAFVEAQDIELQA